MPLVQMKSRTEAELRLYTYSFTHKAPADWERLLLVLGKYMKGLQGEWLSDEASGWHAECPRFSLWHFHLKGSCRVEHTDLAGAVV